MKMYTYAVVFEHGEDGGWAGYVPDLPVILCGARTRRQVEKDIREGIAMYLNDLKKQGQPIPAPKHDVGEVMIEA